MEFSQYNPHERYRRRSARRTLSVIKVLIVLGLVGVGTFHLGRMQAEQDNRILSQQKQQVDEQINQMEEELTRMRAEARTANIKLHQLQASYNEVLPSGEAQELVQLLKQQLDGGVDPKRMEAVIRSVRPPQNCSKPQTRRFVVKTPAYKGPESRITTAGKEVTISGSGDSAKSSQGKSEAWFDPSKAITVVFMHGEGVSEEKTGHLPLYHSIIIGDKEFRFTISQGEQSFAKIVYDVCDYP
ncbi:MAG: hypothetical protein KDI90_02985 [Alphaproteobacteria bacterium]|nr:hypothetical protein [Alphaproteobacteria bacterium]MCB9975506.1 hypothetical protein [Rhodospirillales bacterium]